MRLAPVRRRVEHVDTDASGVVHFARYPSLLETAALENLDRLGTGLDALASDGLDLVVTELTVRYLAPARFLDHLDLELSVRHVGVASFRLSGTVLCARPEPLTTATGTLAFAVIDRTTGAVRTLPERLRTSLKECRDHADV